MSTQPTLDQLRVPQDIKLYIDARLRAHEQQLNALHAGINHKLAALAELERDVDQKIAECQAKLQKLEERITIDPAYKITKAMLIKVAKELEQNNG